VCAECLYVALGGQKTVKAGTVINKGEPQAKAFEPCLLKGKAPLSFSTAKTYRERNAGVPALNTRRVMKPSSTPFA